MKVGVILLCRFSSSRLPGKIFREINGIPIIQYILERISSVVSKEDIVVATSEEISDDVIVDYCALKKVKVFRGSLSNVSKRFLECAKENSFDYAVRINGDNLFVETNVLRHLIEKTKDSDYDFLSNTHGKTFPQGMSVELVNTKFYENSYTKFSSAEDFEHVTWYLHNNAIGTYYFYDNVICPEAKGLKFAIDDENDFELGKAIIAKMNDSHVNYNMKEVVEIYNQIKE